MPLRALGNGFRNNVVPEGTSFPSLSSGVVALKSLFDTIRSRVVDVSCQPPSLAAKPLTVHRVSIHWYGAFMILGRTRPYPEITMRGV
jgi:hypothetical protein